MKTLPNGRTLKSLGVKAEPNGRFHYAVYVEQNFRSGAPTGCLHLMFAYTAYHEIFKELGVINPTGFDEQALCVRFMFEADAALFHLYLA